MNPKPKFFKTSKTFRAWLEKHSDNRTELVVGYWKKGSGTLSMNWSESVDEALCFGWIDGVRRRIDDDSYSIRFTPRRPGSNWSAVNIAKFALLLADGKVTPAGKRAYDSRKESKSKIYSYEQSTTAQLNECELEQFKKKTGAWIYFEDCPPGYRKKVTHWVTSAQKPETRKRRLEKLISACAHEDRLA